MPMAWHTPAGVQLPPPDLRKSCLSVFPK